MTTESHFVCSLFTRATKKKATSRRPRIEEKIDNLVKNSADKFPQQKRQHRESPRERKSDVCVAPRAVARKSS
jgi:hypothetical protein